MRQSTKEKLFTPNDKYKIVNAIPLNNGGDITILIVGANHQPTIVWEYPNEKDGFEVYKAAPGNSINKARKFIGLPEK